MHAQRSPTGAHYGRGDTALLTPGEEIELAARVAAGDEEARARFVQANIRFVISIAVKYTRRDNVPFDDIVQEGMLGVLRAVDKFDATKGVRFTSYAAWWIRQAIGRFLQNDTVVHVPTHATEALVTMQLAERELGSDVTDAALCTVLGWTPKKLARTKDYKIKGYISLDTTNSADEDGSAQQHEVFRTDAPTNEDRLVRESDVQILDQELQQLKQRDYDVVALRYGLVDGKEWTLQEIGDSLGVTCARIRQIQQRVEKCLNERMHIRGAC